MAIGAIENATIARLQDFSTIKQQEDNKAALTQSHIGHAQQKSEEKKPHTVQHSEDVVWQNHNPDAREKGNNEYAGDGGMHRKNKQQVVERVIKKTKPTAGFDMKV